MIVVEPVSLAPLGEQRLDRSVSTGPALELAGAPCYATDYLVFRAHPGGLVDSHLIINQASVIAAVGPGWFIFVFAGDVNRLATSLSSLNQLSAYFPSPGLKKVSDFVAAHELWM
ncbi:hypothetical protein O1611_g5797 [Lasiodiplodia mahajangana]|uniref:Uncharacterized protein n=1 Tax=Lasiodiplodia mahajangana TaxID=1108764 RepID=A0ACC2JK61_9PEZI|nr:hypothetical protein O1611_g5797 [Lasiodiplodia mahajangana]